MSIMKAHIHNDRCYSHHKNKQLDQDQHLYSATGLAECIDILIPLLVNKLCSLQNICMMLKSKNIRWKWHVLSDNIKVDLKEAEQTRKRVQR
jgi:hypothetical protein